MRGLIVGPVVEVSAVAVSPEVVLQHLHFGINLAVH